jgi:hypothetical protein
MKLQVPNFKQHGCTRRLVLDVWMFSGAWSLELGIFPFTGAWMFAPDILNQGLMVNALVNV